VYYAVAQGCGEIYAVPVTGGRPAPVAAGLMPAISPDGTRLAFVRESPAYVGDRSARCHEPPSQGPVNLIIRNLVTQVQIKYPPSQGLNTPLVYPLSHLSWSPDGTRLAESFGEVQDNNGWNLAIMNPAKAKWYIPLHYTRKDQVPVQGATQGFYYREGVYLPDGDLLVNRVCCTGVPVRTTASLIQEVTTAGVPVHRVTTGFLNRDHSSFDAFGRWVLYLSGKDLFVSKNGQPPALLTNSGLVAAAWVPPAGS
jgi:hypothetical protein